LHPRGLRRIKSSATMRSSAIAVLFCVAGTGADCPSSPDCTTCLQGNECGWCAVNTTTATAVGPQCVDMHTTFDCDIQFQTDTCSQGWACANSSGTNAAQCVPSVGGIADKAACEASCSKPPKPPPPPPTPPSPKPNSTFYSCNETTFTCAVAPFGEKTQQLCEDHCKQTYLCDEASKMCVMSTPTAPGHHFDDNATCSANCPSKPMPVPYEMRGIWRGLAIHNGYKPGEWVADIKNDSLTIWYPDTTGTYQIYVEGSADAIGIAGDYIIRVQSTKGKLQGSVRLKAADFAMNPEVSAFLQLAVNENQPATEVTDFDSGMSTATVLSFETCPSGGAPPLPPPPPPTPPPCKAKLDVVVILDGSASISASDWQSAIAFVTKLVDGFSISADEVKLGIVQFSSVATQVIGLSGDKAAIKSQLSSLRQMKENTNTYAGFDKAKSIIDAQGRAVTDGKLAILITDGVQNEGRSASVVADAMKAEQIDIFGIGVGGQIKPSEIQSWCSLPVSDHYFQVSQFGQLELILQKIIQNACPPPAGLARLLPGRPAAKNCKFHLPPVLPTTTAPSLSEERNSRQLFSAPEQTRAPLPEPVPVSSGPGNGSDPCNAFTTCGTCIGQRASAKTCGWCTGQIKGSAFQCAGKDAGASTPGFTCEGHFQTSSCDDPGNCGLEGVFRGLRIDNLYDFGEWSATFIARNNSEEVKITQLDPAGSPKATVEGTLKCNKHCSAGSNDTGVPFTLTTTTGSILHGICGYTDEIQAETSGLMWAIAEAGVGTPPIGFDAAMLNTSNASVFTYYKCADFKQQTCTFMAM